MITRYSPKQHKVLVAVQQRPTMTPPKYTNLAGMVEAKLLNRDEQGMYSIAPRGTLLLILRQLDVPTRTTLLGLIRHGRVGGSIPAHLLNDTFIESIAPLNLVTVKGGQVELTGALLDLRPALCDLLPHHYKDV